jgi:His-Xaa-Ser system radical SAM maturase HxsC
VVLHPSGHVEVLYRHLSRHNTILLTERCNSLCLMCSQPPKEIDDRWRIPVILRALELIDPSCEALGLTGGEPTLLGDGFFNVVRHAHERLPNTTIHVLSNGRLFRNRETAARLASTGHENLLLGIPLYSDIDEQHDFVVQAKGAYDETLIGLYNLATHGIPIELRVVLHAATHRRLPQLAEFIARNLPFVSQVSLMGLEMFGYVHLNMSTVWIDPADYQDDLERATTTLALHGIEPVIFNHQLCVLRQSLWPFAVQSISDWKNVYLAACDGCVVREHCGGFFQSATKQHSAHIRAITREEL